MLKNIYLGLQYFFIVINIFTYKSYCCGGRDGEEFKIKISD